MTNFQSKRILFVINSREEKRALNDLLIEAKENSENIWALFLINHQKEIPLPLGVKLINHEDFTSKEALQEKQREAYSLVNHLNKRIENIFPKVFEVEGISLLEICEIELYFYYATKVFDQLSLAKNILDTLKIDEVRIYGNFEDFVSLRTPRLSTTFLWGFRVAAESIGIDIEIVETKKKWAQYWLKLFLIWGPCARIILQILRAGKVFLKNRKHKLLESVKSRKVLCLNHARPNAITLSPIVEELEKNNWQPIILQVGQHGIEYFEPDFSILPYESFLNIRALWLIFKNLPNLIKNLDRLFVSPLWTGIDLEKPAWDGLLKRLFAGFAATRFPAALCYIAMARESIRRFNPKIVLLTQESNARERAMASVSRQWGCKTIWVQCGLRGEDIFLKYRVSSDWFALETKQAKDAFIKLGYPENRLFVTGQPGHKWLRKKVKGIDKEGVLQQLGIDTKYPIIFYASQGYEEEISSLQNVPTNAYVLYKKTLIKFYDELRILSKEYNFWLIVKPHPKESKELHEMVFQKMDFNKAVLLSPKDDPYRVLGFCDVLISNYSTLAMEALALGKPIIVLEDDRKIGASIFLGCEAAFTVRSLQELRGTLKEVLYSDQEWSDKCRRFLEWQSGGPQGIAARRVVQLIQNLSRSS